MRLWWIFLSVLLLACHQAPPAPEVVRVVRTEKLLANDTVDVHFAANIRARWESPQAFLLAGRVAAREVELGEMVAKNQVLLRLDDHDFRLDLAAKMAAKSAAEKDFSLKKQELARYLALKNQGFVSQADIDRLRLAHDAALETLKQAAAAVKLSEKRLSDTVLRAEQAGVVAALSAEVGQVIAAGQVVARLANADEVEAQFFIAEAARNAWQVGDALDVEILSEDAPIAAKVRELAATADPTTRMFEVRAELLNAPKTVRVGSSARVLRRQDLQGEHSIPLSALSSLGGQNFVWVLDAKTSSVKKTPVDVASLSAKHARIRAGLRGDEELVTAGVHLLRDGEKVRKLAAVK